MLIIDAESNDVVEKFSANLIYSPISFNHHDHLFNNILIFMVQHPNETQGFYLTFILYIIIYLLSQAVFIYFLFLFSFYHLPF